MMKKKNLVPQKRFKEFKLYEAWKCYELGNVIDEQYNGQTPSRFNSLFWNGNINWLTSGELNRRTVFKTIEQITEAGRRNANLKVIPKGTFIMAITGLEAAGTRGNCAILGIDTTLNQSCMAIFPKRKYLNSQFLFYWYRKVGEEFGLRYTQGTKQQSYNAELINILPITIPGVKEQQKIGEFFKVLDERIANQERKIAKVKALKSAYLNEMFPQEGEAVPRRRFKGFEGEWERTELGSIGRTFSGLSGKTKKDFGHGTAEYVTYMNVFNNTISEINNTERVVYDNKQTQVKYGDIFFTTSSETPNEVGMSSVWLDDRPNIYLNSFCFGFRSVINVDYYFIGYMLRANLFRKQMEVLAQGISRYNISKSKVLEIEVYLPTIQEQQKIGEFFKNLDDQITAEEKKLEKLKEMKEAYLEEMFV